MRPDVIRRLQCAAALMVFAASSACAGRGGFGGAIPNGEAASALRGPLAPVRSAQKLRSLMKGGLGADAPGGAGYPVTAEPPVSHPAEKPCVDKLFNPQTPPLQSGQLNVGDFADYSDHPFNYTPPANCPGPYAKIVFKMHFRVTAGVQYDRTGAVWIGATNVYFGTTVGAGPQRQPGVERRARRDRVRSDLFAGVDRTSVGLQHRQLAVHRHHLRHGGTRLLSRRQTVSGAARRRRSLSAIGADRPAGTFISTVRPIR